MTKYSRRNCYFENERYLRYFRAYNQFNCELECWANVSLKYCGCVKFSMPSMKPQLHLSWKSNKISLKETIKQKYVVLKKENAMMKHWN